MSATHHPEKPMTTTDAPVADHRPKGRPVGTYNTAAGAQRRLWRQHGRGGMRLVDVVQNGRGRRYLIERALTADEADALVADYLTQATALGDCPMCTPRRSKPCGDDTFRSMPTTGAAGRLTAAGVVNWSFGPRQTTASANRRSGMMPRSSARRTALHSADCGTRWLSVAMTRRGRATAAHALTTRLLEEIVRPRGGGTRIAVFSPIRGID
jgi:hypothetical protein